SIPSAIIFIFGITGNLAIIITMIRYHKTKSKERFFCLIGNLAGYDIFILLFSMTLKMTNYFITWPFGSFLCHIYNGFQSYFMAGSAITMTFMALEHYRVVIKEVNAYSKSSGKIIITVVIALTASICACPSIIYSKYVSHSESSVKCFIQFFQDLNQDKIVWQTYRNCRYVIFYLFPLIVVVTTYFQMLLTLNRYSRTSLAEYHLTKVKEQKNIMKMILYTNVTFVICWTPYFMYGFIVYFNHTVDDGIQLHRLIRVACELIAYINSAIHPFIYAKY
ncbi:uncharacterized protein TRIADDRAFT_3799, partial [Trichoplax adhaerens]